MQKDLLVMPVKGKLLKIKTKRVMLGNVHAKVNLLLEEHVIKVLMGILISPILKVSKNDSLDS